MNNIFENPWAVLIGAILVLIGGTLMVSQAPSMILFSGLMALTGKICILIGGCFLALAIFLLFS
jgi:hypothetical protein